MAAQMHCLHYIIVYCSHSSTFEDSQEHRPRYLSHRPKKLRVFLYTLPGLQILEQHGLDDAINM